MKRLARTLLFVAFVAALFSVGFLRGINYGIAALTGSEVEGVELHVLPHDPESF